MPRYFNVALDYFTAYSEVHHKTIILSFPVEGVNVPVEKVPER